MSAARAVPRAYLAGSPPASPRAAAPESGRRGRSGGPARESEEAGSLLGSRSKLGRGGRRGRPWAPFQRCCVRAGRLPNVGVGRADGGGAKAAGRRVAFGQWPRWGRETRRDRRPARIDPKSRPHPHAPGGGVTVGTSRSDHGRPGAQGFRILPTQPPGHGRSVPLYDVAGGTPLPRSTLPAVGRRAASR